MLALIVLSSLWFVEHAWTSGWQGLLGRGVDSRLFAPGALTSNLNIFAHMVLGAVVTLVAPFQLWHWPRHKAPRIHRLLGYLLATTAALTGVGGLVYIALRGTIGGWPMDVGFALYGALMIVAAVRTVERARARDFATHRRWAWRLFVLAMGSWLYRMHYGLWHATTGGIASYEDFSGAFDLVQNVAFYLPYLLLLEIWFRTGDRHNFRSTQTSR
jgi:uncharacterized membrane protein